jgi:hypothetical protein
MGRSKRTIGVINRGIPYWSWFAGSAADCRWIHGDKEFLVHGTTKPRFVEARAVELGMLLKEEPVQFVLFD